MILIICTRRPPGLFDILDILATGAVPEQKYDPQPGRCLRPDAPCEEYPNGRVRIEWKDSWTV